MLLNPGHLLSSVALDLLHDLGVHFSRPRDGKILGTVPPVQTLFDDIYEKVFREQKIFSVQCVHFKNRLLDTSRSFQHHPTIG